jgi:pimeloyl-ACP methyl ester carboxylesterase
MPARLLHSSFVLALLCSCACSNGPSVTTGSGGAGTGSGTGGGQTGSGTGGSQTGSGTGGTSAGTGGSDTGTATGGSDAGTGGSETEAGTGGSGTGGSGTGGSDPSGGAGSEDPEVTVLLAGDDVNSDGPLDTTLEENLSFSGGGHILVRPTNITTEPNTKHPVLIWGPGGGTAPAYYLQLLTRVASQGFVVVGIRESTGDSVLMSAAIDWLEEQDADSNSPMYDRLILDRVGVFGHSMGGLSSEVTALLDDRVTTALLDNSGAFSHDALVDVTIPVGIIYGEDGQEAPNAVGDYENPGNQGPCWLSMMTGGGHGSGPWDGAAANVAWMRWHIGGENSRKDAFLGDGGAYNDTGIWVTDFKNWDDWKNWNE